ncbi:MAG: beta-galactosidase [Candidatus Sumerlaeota bacterium]|nr:beta-galactosidase [Candidatus Sumerlaeota bacterium]
MLATAAFAAERPSTTPTARSLPGKGVFVTGKREMFDFPDEVKKDPLVAGFQVSLGWSDLEPEKGRYEWSQIDQLLADCEKWNKQAAFKFMTVGGKVMSDGQLSKGKGKAGPDVEGRNTTTPAWLFDDPAVKRFGGIPTPKGKLPLYPVFWDPAYQKHLEDFIAAFAQRYNGNPRIEYIRMGGWQVGTNEPSFYGGASEFLLDQFAAEGMKIPADKNMKEAIRGLAGDSPYSKAVISMIDIWRKHFTKTPLAATIHFSKEAGSFEEAMMSHCFANHIMIMNTGLNESDHTESRTAYREARDQHGCKVGWGGITHIGTKLSKEELEKRGHSLRLEAVMQGIGDDNLPGYAPASKVSYLVFGFDFTEDAEAMKWAAEHLVE